MAIPDAVHTNFQTLCRAIRNGDGALMECYRKDNGDPVDVICAVIDSGNDVAFVPFAYMPRDHVIYDLVDSPK